MFFDSRELIPFPTVDRPFGVQLWPLLENLWTQFLSYPPQDFRFVPGKTPLSTLGETAAALVTYYAVILGGRELMKGREPFKLNALFKLHNLFLSVVSGGLLALFVEQLVPTVARNGIFFAACHKDGGWTDRLVVLYYLNYLVKFIELLDTVYLVLKKKPLTFLHTYHHGATALLCYSQLLALTPTSWVVITLNLAVHVVMYWYYFQAARGIRVWWKEYITILQIIQFVIALGFVYFGTYTVLVSHYAPWMPSPGRCSGEWFAIIPGCFIISSYLLLFVSFYVATYKKTGKTGSKKGITANKTLIDGSHLEIPSPTADPSQANQERRGRKADVSSNGTANSSASVHAKRRG